MKQKFYTFLSFVCCSLAVFSQNSLPNGDFENWNTSIYGAPLYTIVSSNQDEYFRCRGPFNCVKTTDAYHGSFAVQLTTYVSGTDTCTGYFVNGNANSSNANTWTGGIPYNRQPTGMEGWYKSAIAAGDSGVLIVDFKAADTSIGLYAFKLSGTHNVYTPFSFVFNPPLTAVPDTIIFGATSSDFINNTAIAGSMLQLDSISFTGVASQPAQFYGDFELWQSDTINSPVSWMPYGGGNGVLGFNQTTDAYSGNFALELLTTLGDRNGVPTANQGGISTGYWDNSCSCQRGGYPFSNQVDTLAFYYKYAPALATDSAQVYATFKKNGSVIWNMGQYLGAAASYRYVELPFNAGQVPDTAIVEVSSSLYNDTAVGYAGAVLKIDDIHFKSQTVTGILNLMDESGLLIYPNPARNEITISVGDELIGATATITDITGRQIKISNLEQRRTNIELSNIASGVYFVRVTKDDKLTVRKLVVVE